VNAAIETAPSGNRYLAGFMTLSLLAGIANGTAKVLLPLYAASLHASRTQIGIIGGLQFLGLLLLSLPIGTLLGRVGSRTMFRVGAIGGAAVYALLFPLVSLPWQLIACVILFGIFNPMRMVTTQTEFLHLLHTVDSRKAGWNRAAHTSGMFFLGPMLGATVLTALGYAAAFQLSAIALLVAVLIGDRILASLPAQTPAQTYSLREHARGFVTLLKTHRELRTNLFLEFVGQVTMTYFSVFVVLMAIQKFQLGAHAAAALVTVQGACFVFALVTFGALVERLSQPARFGLAFALMALSQACFMAATGYGMLVAGALLLGIGLALQHLATVGRFAALARELGRGRIGGLSTISGPFGGIVGAVLGGLVAEHLGLAVGFRILFVIFALLFVLTALRRGRGRPRIATASLSEPS
jgi:MFS family permease